MELNSVRKIAETEEEADEIIQKAKQHAEKIIQSAIDSKEQKEAQAKKRIDDARKDIEQKTTAENVDTINEISYQTKSECETIERKANEKMQTAIDAIFKEVIS